MEIDITSLLESDQWGLSHSQAEGGPTAGRDTWNASLARAEETVLLDAQEKLQAMRDFARESGGWSAGEIAAWTHQEINALFLQWIAGDVRQCPAILPGITFEERQPGEWWYEDENEEGYEYGPFRTRSKAYGNHAWNSYPTADSLDEIDWPQTEQMQHDGGCPSNLFRAEDGKIYFSLSN